MGLSIIRQRNLPNLSKKAKILISILDIWKKNHFSRIENSELGYQQRRTSSNLEKSLKESTKLGTVKLSDEIRSTTMESGKANTRSLTFYRYTELKLPYFIYIDLFLHFTNFNPFVTLFSYRLPSKLSNSSNFPFPFCSIFFRIQSNLVVYLIHKNLTY